jgi:hypothetical protein
MTSETLLNFYQTTRRYNPEDRHLHTRRRENLKSDLLLPPYGMTNLDGDMGNVDIKGILKINIDNEHISSGIWIRKDLSQETKLFRMNIDGERPWVDASEWIFL